MLSVLRQVEKYVKETAVEEKEPVVDTKLLDEVERLRSKLAKAEDEVLKRLEMRPQEEAGTFSSICKVFTGISVLLVYLA